MSERPIGRCRMVIDSQLDDMAISKTEWETIRGLIQEAVNPNGWRRLFNLFNWLRSWSLVGPSIAAFIAITAIAVMLGVNFLNKSGANARFQQHTEDRLTGIEKSLLEIQAKMVVSSPPDPQNQADAKNLLAEAKREPVPLSVSIVEQAGDKFITAAKSDPKAWNVAMEFVAYRSSLNLAEKPPDKFSGRFKVGGEFPLAHIEMVPVEGKPEPSVGFSDFLAPFESSAKVERLGPLATTELKNAVGPRIILLSGGALIIDGFYMSCGSDSNLALQPRRRRARPGSARSGS